MRSIARGVVHSMLGVNGGKSPSVVAVWICCSVQQVLCAGDE